MSIISAERIQEEFMKLLAARIPSVGFLDFVSYKVICMNFCLKLFDLDGVEEKYGQNHKNNMTHTFQVVDNMATRTNNILLRFAALLHDIGKPGTKRFQKGRGWTFDMHEHLGKK